MLSPAIRDFFARETAAGYVLMAVTVLALIAANSPWAGLYETFRELPLPVHLGPVQLDKTVILWINDGLMALFFLLVGLEIKREVMVGELSSSQKLAMPTIAALGGVVVPALFYLAVAGGTPAAQGWAIPAATDIAFALGVLTLAGPRVPASLKVFLTALAIIDDLAAIVIIALFYTSSLSLAALGLAAVAIVALVILNRLGVRMIWPYLLVGAFLWLCVLKSGVHATLAGVVVALAIPLRPKKGEAAAPLIRLEHALHGWVTFGVLPVFAFANAGLPLIGLQPAALLAPIPAGIALGLIVGKPVGVIASAWIAVWLGWARLPKGTGWRLLMAAAPLTGIGFTMSLFIGGLALPDDDNPIRLGVLVGSLVSGVLGYGLIVLALRRRQIHM